MPTKASVNEIGNLSDLLDTVDLPESIALKADKGYPSEKNGQLLKSKKLKNHILKKAKKNKPLTLWEKRFNKLVGKTRFNPDLSLGIVMRT